MLTIMRGPRSHAMQTDSGAAADVTSIDSPGRRLFFRTAMLIVALEPLVIVAVLVAVGLPWEVILVLLGGLLTFVTLTLWLLVVLVWKPLERRYPPQGILPGAISQTWQSFAFGPLMRLNNCLTIVADEKHLHMRPFAAMQWLGAGWISLPLDGMRDVEPAIMGQMSADLDGRMITGPRWCLSLAAGAPQPAAANNST